MNEFISADPDLCYLDGNSLGRLPIAAMQRVESLVRHGWGEDLIRGWNKDWIHLPSRIGNKIAGITGAREGEVVVADSTSVNLFKLATAALKSKPSRPKIVTDATNFPSDLYVLEAAAESAGHLHQLETVGSCDAIEAPAEAVIEAIDERTALVSLTHVAFRSGAKWDIEQITKVAHQAGALVLWDLSHSVGAVPVELNRWQVDMAVGCTYKYLCGGPGAPAFLYVRSDLQDELENPLQGWFSHRRPFDFVAEYEASDSIERFQTGTPPILSMAAIEAGVDLVSEVGIAELRRRSVALSEQFIAAADQQLSELGFVLRSPRTISHRGSHLSYSHPEARRITENLITRHKVIPDFRAPDNIRFGFAPLYNSPADVEKAMVALRQTVQHREYEDVIPDTSPVT